MSAKTFRVAVQSDPVEFTLEYTKGPDKDHASKTFHCRPTIPVGLILEFASLSDPDAPDTGGRAMTLIGDLYKKAIVPDEYEAFENLLQDPDVGIDVEMYSEIAGWLAGEYTARPTGKNSESSSPAPLSGTALTGGVLPVALTYSRPDQDVLTH